MSRALRMIVVPAILLLGASYAGLLLDEERERLEIPRSAARMTLGGFEPISANLLKLRADELMKSRRFAEAVALGANAIIGLRFTTSAVMQGAAEILVFGTAVVLQPTSSD